MKKPFVTHPFLFAVFPILFLFAHNIHEFSFSQIMLPLTIILGLTFLLVWLSRFILKDNIKGGIIVSLFLVMFFSYGHIYAIVFGTRVGNIIIGRHMCLFPTWCIIYIFCNYFFITKQHKSLYNFTKILNIIAFSLILISLFNIGIYKFNLLGSWQDKNIHIENRDNDVVVGLENKTLLRDIYYIILDGYASSKTLKEVYEYDNSEFTDYLTKEGFFIDSKSRSNYATTFLSLASSLNMEYINYLSSVIGIESKDRSIPNQLIKDSKVMRFLKLKGYKFIHFSSGWGATNHNKYADLNIRCYGKGNEFLMVLIQTTILNPFTRYIIEDDIRGRILGTFSELAEVYQIKGPKFVFAHINCPHPPYVFKANGDPVPETKLQLHGSVWKQKELYLNQLVFVNKKVKTLVKEILLKSEITPIIILQADHGTASTFGDWEHPTEEMIKERMTIFNAYYLPGGGNALLYDFITPVNTFRLIFNFYFSMNYKLLKDQSYFSSYEFPYKFVDVTDKVKYD